MPAFTTIIAGVSALGSLAGVKQARDVAGDTRKAQAQQQVAAKSELEAALEVNRVSASEAAAKKTAAQEQSSLSGQDQGLKVADVELGTNKASDELLKRTKQSTAKKAKTGSGTKIGGLQKGKAGKVGGL